nr:MAG TPA: Protein of unknown function (DUF2635) [Caudoviricetes sp.]
MPKIFVKPAKDSLKVRKPDMTVLSAQGEAVEDNIYWRRRQRDNEVIITAVAPKPAAQAPAEEPKTAKKGK